MICPFCQQSHDNEGDRYGCPWCHGEGFPVTDTHKDIDTAFAIASWGCLVAVALLFLAGIV